MYNAFKYRLKPTKEQEQILSSYAGSTRFIWNYFLDLNTKKYQEEKKFIFNQEMITSLPKLKLEINWLNDIPSQALQQKLLDLHRAIEQSFRSSKGFPKFKSKHHNNDSFRLIQVNQHIKPTKKQIKLPKIGWVKWVKHRPLEGKLKSITIKKENDCWWCVCLCDIGDCTKQLIDVYEDKIVGIDLGLIDFLTTSENEVIKTPKLYRKKQKALAKQQRKHAKKQKGSKNKEKERKKLNKIHFKIKCARQDFTHKTSTSITKRFGFIGVEDLNINGIKKRFGKSVSDQGWAMFLNQLDYKSKKNGGKMVKIDRFAPSSKTCSNCGKKHDMPLSQRQMDCECGLNISRDLNAAINIKKWALDELNRCGTHRIQACGDTSIGLDDMSSNRYVLTKQEKDSIFDREATFPSGA